jgi:flavin-dependent dehydrogenase
MFGRTRYDALVVGARCAGAATAMLLARRGLRVLAIDRGERGADTLSTHALMRGGVLQLHRWGVLPRIVAAGTPAVRGTVFHYGDEALEVAVKPGRGVDALYAPRRTVLDSALVDAALEAGAEVRHGRTLVELDRRPDGRVAGAVVLDRAGNRCEIAADLVIGADGVGSAVARLAGAPMLREALHTSAVVYGHWDGLGEADYHWHYREGVSAGVIPTNGGRHCVFVAVPTRRFRDGMRRDLAAAYGRALAGASPALGRTIAACRLESRLWAFAGRRGFMRQACGPGWALVGDAGYFKDPLTAHGITDALRDAELLAAAAASGSAAGFAGYAAMRDELSLRLFEATDAIASFDWDLDRLQGHHQALNAAMKREVEHLAALDDACADSRSPMGAPAQQQEMAA